MIKLFSAIKSIFGIRSITKHSKYTLDNYPANNGFIVYDVVLEKAINLFDAYARAYNINPIRDEKIQRCFFEAYVFILWELDLNLCLNKQSNRVRQKTYEINARLAVRLSATDLDVQDIVELGYQRFDEYGQLFAKGDGKVGALYDLVSNHVIYNMQHAEKHNQFYTPKEFGGLYLLGAFTVAPLQMIMAVQHFSLKVYCHELLNNCLDYMSLEPAQMLDRHEKAVNAMIRYADNVSKMK